MAHFKSCLEGALCCGLGLKRTPMEDGAVFPFYTPLLDNSAQAPWSMCDFSGAEESWTYSIEQGGATQSVRAGWNSTVIPCSNANVVYKSDSVLPVTLNGQTWYLMFAVQCDGRGLGDGEPNTDNGSNSTVLSTVCPDYAPHTSEADDSDLAESLFPGQECAICWPGDGGCLNGQFPVTRYVFFLCPNARFQEDTYGPFDLLPEAPDPTELQWVGVPQAFLSPDGEYLFFYIHPQISNTTAGQMPYAGLNVAPMSEVRRALGRILGNFSPAPAPSTVCGLAPLSRPVQALGQVVAELFVNLGLVEICGTTIGASVPDLLVDEHFIFCSSSGQLNLYFVDVSEDNELFAIRRASATLRYDAASLAGAIGQLRAEQRSAALAQIGDMLIRFDLSSCVSVNAKELQQTEGVVRSVSVNDPTVFEAPPQNGPTLQYRTVLLFHSEGVGALLSMESLDPCCLGTCEDSVGTPKSSAVLVEYPPKYDELANYA